MKYPKSDHKANETATPFDLARIGQFEEIIDVRSPREYIIDHIPGACNFPVLNDNERIHIGTLYKQHSSFEANKQGAAIIASRIAKYLGSHFVSRPGDWRPLVYCWRGGKRSEAFVHVLQQIGWRAVRLPGGYKAYRRTVTATITDIVGRINFKVLCGLTGVGKSALLETLGQRNAQVLDLEKLANHRGSVLGNPVAGEQPTQKYFESLLCRALHRLDTSAPVYVEAESRKIGKLYLPTELLRAIRQAECIRIEADIDARTRYLLDEYHHFLSDRKLLESSLSLLAPFVGRQKIAAWTDWKTGEDAENMVRKLLVEHYDPIYARSMASNFDRYTDAQSVKLTRINNETLNSAAGKLLGDPG